MKGSGSSSGAPMRMPSSHWQSRSISASPRAPSGTISRRAQVQRWPAVIQADCTMCQQAASRSARLPASAISGLLPPSSSARITSGRPANFLWISAPVCADPVKSTPLRPCESSNAAPVSRAPCRRLSTPTGKPAASQASIIKAATPGVSSLGLNSTQLPASSAGTMWPFGR